MKQVTSVNVTYDDIFHPLFSFQAAPLLHPSLSVTEQYVSWREHQKVRAFFYRVQRASYVAHGNFGRSCIVSHAILTRNDPKSWNTIAFFSSFIISPRTCSCGRDLFEGLDRTWTPSGVMIPSADRQHLIGALLNRTFVRLYLLCMKTWTILMEVCNNLRSQYLGSSSTWAGDLMVPQVRDNRLYLQVKPE